MSAAVPSPAPRSTFRRIRTAVLLSLLVVTAAWGATTAYRRRARSSWDRPLQVGIVLLAPDGTVDVEAWRSGAARLSDRMGEEMRRWRGRGDDPFQISVVGPVAWDRPLPFTPPTSSFLDRAWHAIEVWRTVREIDDAAGGVAGGFDVRVFLLTEPGRGDRVGFAEGSGARNGEVAFVRASPGRDLAIPLQAVGHEILHTVGASDKYDEQGHASEPEGLADPGRVPRYPQDHAEWMAGEVAIGPGRGRVPESIDELRVGAATASEIGWVKRDRASAPRRGGRRRRGERAAPRSTSSGV
jgi:hypothetical protein